MVWPRCYMCYSRIPTILHDCLYTRCIGAKIINSWTEASTGRYVLRASESHKEALLHTWNAVLLLSVTPLQSWKQTGKIYEWTSPDFLISKKAKVVHPVGKVIVVFVFWLSLNGLSICVRESVVGQYNMKSLNKLMEHVWQKQPALYASIIGTYSIITALHVSNIVIHYWAWKGVECSHIFYIT